uniref:RNA-directed RNA polymerase n=1 Tax=Conidiobolus lamprauges totivirus 2 TaxID=2980981 RepID=A0A977R5I9_9VIRU|nr:RNA-dependent RNA polymerase [Conidiobolus lamprauges totivirus 2]
MADGHGSCPGRSVYWAKRGGNCVSYSTTCTSRIRRIDVALPLIINERGEWVDKVDHDTYIGVEVVNHLEHDNYLNLEKDSYNRVMLSYYKYRGVIMPGIWIKIEDLYAFYVKFDMITRLHTSAYQLVGGIMSGTCRAHYGAQWYDCLEKELDIKAQQVSVKKGQYKREKISSEHHTLMRPEEVLADLVQDCKIISNGTKIEEVTFEVTNEREHVAATLVNNKLGIETEVTIATMLLYIAVAPAWAVRLLYYLLAKATDVNELKTFLKYEGLVAKQLQHAGRHDLNVVFELSVLWNRLDMEVDWEKEKLNRTSELNTVNLTKGTVYNRAKRIFTQAMVAGAVPKYQTWEKYYKMRWALLPTGSFVSQYQEDRDIKKTIPARLANKTTIMATIPKLEYGYFSERKPQIYASTSIKYEWGKVRALYGCDITSSILTDFCMSNAEECLPGYFPVGNNANEQYVKTAFKALEGIPVCYDYDDFNSQHSIQSMTEVIDAWRDIYANYLSQEQNAALQWVKESLYNMTVNNSITSDKYEAKGTLFSGWRLTSFMNSVLNRVYLEEAGLEKLLTYSLHNGDDVFGVSDKMTNILTLIQQAEALGIRAQVTKMSIGTIGEFLRVDNLSKDPTGAQYLTRSCSTAVHSRIESEAVQTLRSSLDATRDRMLALENRGGDPIVVNKIFKRITTRLESIFEAEPGTAFIYYNTHPVQGGCNPNAEVRDIKLVEEVVLEPDNQTLNLAARMTAGSRDYIDALCAAYDIKWLPDKENLAYNMNLRLLSQRRISMKIVNENRGDVKMYKALFKSHKAGRVIANLSKARLLRDLSITFYDAPSRGLIAYLQKVKDPFQFLSTVL